MGNRQLARLLVEVIARLDQLIAIIEWEEAIMAGIKPGPKELALREMREKRARVAKSKADIDKAIKTKPVLAKPRTGSGARRGK